MQIKQPNISQLEQNLSDTLRQSLALNFDLRLSKNPLTADKSVLAFLSFENSVDYIPKTATELQQRTLIANSLNYHKIKGTIASLKLAVKPFGKIIKIEEWFNNSRLRRGTMELEIEVTDKITEITSIELTQLINHTKRACIHLANIFLVQKNIGNYYTALNTLEFEIMYIK